MKCGGIYTTGELDQWPLLPGTKLTEAHPQKGRTTHGYIPLALYTQLNGLTHSVHVFFDYSILI